MKKPLLKSLLIMGSLSMIAGAPLAHASVSTYNVVETFYEPQTQPNNSIFTGTFTFDSATGTVSNLAGSLTESMTGMMGGTMNALSLNYQLSSVYDPTLGGLLVTTFLNNNTNTLYTGLGGNGWAPGSGMGMYYNFPGTNPGNAYAMIFVNTLDPTAALTQAQIDKLAYADCTPGGMMASVCMTGTSVAGYGTVGTMGGYPISETVTAVTSPVPEPKTYLMLLLGLGFVGFVARRQRKIAWAY